MKIRRSSLRQKIAVLLMATVSLTVLSIGFSEVYFSYHENVARALSAQFRETRLLASRVRVVLDSVESQILYAATQPWSTEAMPKDTFRAELYRLLRVEPAISDVHAISPDGVQYMAVSRLSADDAPLSADAMPADVVKKLALSNTVYGATQLRDGLDPSVTIVAFPNRSGASDNARSAATTPNGLLLVKINLRSVAESLKPVSVIFGAESFIVDADGVTIAHPDPSRILHHEWRRPTPNLLEVLGASRANQLCCASGRGRNSRGDAVYHTVAPIKGTDWHLVVERPDDEILASVLATVKRSLVGLAAGLFLVLFVSILLARRLSDPILRVQRGAERMGGGELGTRISVSTGDEIEALAGQFNAMANQLQDYTTSLEQKVAEKTAQLEAANQHKSEFLANMSHELRTPLNAVIGFSDALKEQYFGELNAKQMEYANDISASGQHLLSLINDILDLSKIEAGKMELELSRFSLDDAVRNALTLVRERAQKNFITLKSDVAEGLSDVVADERKVKQILINLVTNAVKFSYPNGLVLVSAWRDKNALCVAVKDTGAGIAPEDHATIFEEFQQVASGGSAKYEGTGLGLSLARRMAELHGGTLTVASTRGHGATFTFSFPVDLVVVPLQV